MEPQTNTRAEPQSKPRGRPFPPGNNANPRGGGAVFKEAIAIAVEELVTDFVQVHGRAPSRAEAVMVGGLARVERRLRYPALNTEDLNRTLNTARRLRCDLGLRVKSASARLRPSALEILGGK
jgi:hypothetical protein